MGLEHKNSALYFFKSKCTAYERIQSISSGIGSILLLRLRAWHFRGLWLSRLTGPEVHRSLALATTTRLKTQKERTSAVAKCKAMVVYESEENNIDGNIAKRNKCEAAFVGLL